MFGPAFLCQTHREYHVYATAVLECATTLTYLHFAMLPTLYVDTEITQQLDLLHMGRC